MTGHMLRAVDSLIRSNSPPALRLEIAGNSGASQSAQADLAKPSRDLSRQAGVARPESPG